MAARRAQMASQSYHSSGSIGSVKAARPSACDRHWPMVTAALPAWANGGHTSATGWS